MMYCNMQRHSPVCASTLDFTLCLLYNGSRAKKPGTCSLKGVIID